MRSRVTLTHDILGSLVINEPGGLKDSKISLQRHPEFHSMIETLQGEFTFYGNNGVENGGIEFIKEVEQTYGPDAKLEILVEISQNDIDYTTLFEGLLDIAGGEEYPDNTMKVPIIRNDAWSRFINHWDTPVNIQSTTTLAGNPIDPCVAVTLSMPSQKIRQKFEGTSVLAGSTSENFSIIDIGDYYQMSFDVKTLDEIENIYPLPQVTNPVLPAPWFQPEYAGSYTFVIQTVVYDYGPWVWIYPEQISDYIRVYLNIDGVETPFTLGSTFDGGSIGDGRVFTLTHTATLTTASKVYLYGKAIANLSASSPGFDGEIRWNGAVTGTSIGNIESYARVTGDTTAPDTEAESFLLHDVIDAVVRRITG